MTGTDSMMTKIRTRAGQVNWQAMTARYSKPDALRSAWQIANSVIPYLALWYLMYRSLAVSYWLTLAIAPLAAGFMIRIFIIFHDCTHGAFFRSKRANAIVGYFTGVLTFTPYDNWRREHAIHHATSGDLDRRDHGGEIWTLTVDEYLEAHWRTRIAYRLYRNPLLMFGIGWVYIFMIAHRFGDPNARGRERMNVMLTNLGLLAFVAFISLTMGVEAYFLIQIPIFAIGGPIGIWLFYVQHQFESTYFERHDIWEYFPAAMHGSSFYKLPRVLQWFTGNIGYHHIHHLSPRIPNYWLPRVHEENPELAAIPEITLLRSLKSLGYRLWDEEHKRMVGFGYLRQLRRQVAVG